MPATDLTFDQLRSLSSYKEMLNWRKWFRHWCELRSAINRSRYKAAVNVPRWLVATIIANGSTFDRLISLLLFSGGLPVVAASVLHWLDLWPKSRCTVVVTWPPLITGGPAPNFLFDPDKVQHQFSIGCLIRSSICGEHVLCHNTSLFMVL